MTIAPTGTGKTTGPVICNALAHPGQLIVLDIKGDVLRATYARRRALGPVHVLDLNDKPKHGGSLNPLDLVPVGETAVVSRTLAASIVQRTGDEREPFWNNFAETLIAGAIAYQTAKGNGTIGAVFDFLSDSDSADYNIAVIVDGEGKTLPRVSSAAFKSYLSLPDRETRPSVMGTVNTHLRLFDSELSRRLTDTTSIDLGGLLQGQLMTLYIVVPPHLLAAYRPLLRLWVSGLIMLFTQRTKLPRPPRSCSSTRWAISAGWTPSPPPRRCCAVTASGLPHSGNPRRSSNATGRTPRPSSTMPESSSSSAPGIFAWRRIS